MFRVNDIVALSPDSEHHHQAPFPMQGVITMEIQESTHRWRVQWVDGGWNGYRDEDLILVPTRSVTQEVRTNYAQLLLEYTDGGLRLAQLITSPIPIDPRLEERLNETEHET